MKTLKDFLNEQSVELEDGFDEERTEAQYLAGKYNWDCSLLNGHYSDLGFETEVKDNILTVILKDDKDELEGEGVSLEFDCDNEEIKIELFSKE